MALDGNYEKIFVIFGAGLKLFYEGQIGNYVEKAMCWNIEEYASINPPEITKHSRHKEYKEWLLSNSHLSWPPWARAGVYHWGIWMEQGHVDLGSVPTRDTKVKTWMEIVIWPLFKSISVLTRAQQILLAAVDMECIQKYEEILKRCPDATRRLFTTDESQCFTLRVCLVNVFTEPHVDSGDMKNGWESMYPLGECESGDFCITKLKTGGLYIK